MRENTVLAQRLNLDELRLEGEPVSVAQDVRTGGVNGRNSFSVSENGAMVYRSSGDVVLLNSRLTWYRRDGTPAGTALQAGAIAEIELSPDDERVAVVNIAPALAGQELWLIDLASGVFSPLLAGGGVRGNPLWSPDSSRVAFEASGNGREIRRVLIGSGAESALLADGENNYLHDWTRDGKTILFGAGTTGGLGNVFALPLEGDAKPQPIYQSAFAKDQIRVSPDGRWVTYRSDESGQAEVYVAAFPAFTDRRQVSAGGAIMPRWRSDGRELFYVTLGRSFVARDVTSGATLDIGPPRELFETRMTLSPANYYYAVTRDGQRFLVREPVSDVSDLGDEPLHVILNWPALLAQ